MGGSESGGGSQGHPVCVSSRDLVTLSPLADVSVELRDIQKGGRVRLMSKRLTSESTKPRKEELLMARN